MVKSKGIYRLIAAHVLLLFWALVIFKLSSEGHDTSSGRSDAIVAYLQQAGSTLPSDVLSFLTRKGAHTIAYFIFGALAYNVMRHYALPMRRMLGVSALIVLGYALSDEFHQLFVPGRTGMFSDVLIDTVAGVLSITVVYFIHRRIIRRQDLRKKENDVA